jgi:hypothetical protein
VITSNGGRGHNPDRKLNIARRLAVFQVFLNDLDGSLPS